MDLQRTVVVLAVHSRKIGSEAKAAEWKEAVRVVEKSEVEGLVKWEETVEENGD